MKVTYEQIILANKNAGSATHLIIYVKIQSTCYICLFKNIIVKSKTPAEKAPIIIIRNQSALRSMERF